jgi:hypothetical protein
MTRNLFSGHVTSGVKLAGLYHGRLYGTREVAIILLSFFEETNIPEGWYEIAAADQIVVAWKLLKGNGAKGLACSEFSDKLQPVKWDD